jgi:N-acetyl-gamma-glutamyl-phosphate reductase
MITEFEDSSARDYTTTAFRPYGLSLEHKHVPEMQLHSGLLRRPLFAPAVGRYRQGMIVEAPLHLGAMPGRPTIADVHGALERAYLGATFVKVGSLDEAKAMSALDPESQNGGNTMKLFVFGSDTLGQARLVAILDNLGKGASGAAVQNLNLMLGLGETSGL